MSRSLLALACVGVVGCFDGLVEAAPQYNIVDIGAISPGTTSQGLRVSTNGYATGRSLITGGSLAFIWSPSSPITALPNLASPARAFGVGNSVNSFGVVVGQGNATSFGSNPLPLIWQNGTVAQVPMPVGETVGRANDINDSGLIVGSVNGGINQRAYIYSNGSARIMSNSGTITTTSAWSVNNSGIAVGQGTDSTNAARNAGFIYDTNTDTLTDLGGLGDFNGCLPWDISNAGHVVGGSMQNQAASLPFIWTTSTGMLPIPLPTGTSQGSARGVNSSGWAVGTASSAFAIPFLFDGVATYRIGDLIPANSGWDLLTNTSSSALGISEDGIIVGTGVFNGQIHAYAMIPVPEPATVGLIGIAGATALRRRRA